MPISNKIILGILCFILRQALAKKCVKIFHLIVFSKYLLVSPLKLIDWSKATKNCKKNLLQVLWSWYKVSDKILILCHIIKKVKMFVLTWFYIPYFCTAFVFMIDTWCHSLILCNLQAQICLLLQYVIQQLWNQNIEQRAYNNILLHILIYSFMIMGIWSQRVCGCTKMSLASSVIKHFYYSYLS